MGYRNGVPLRARYGTSTTLGFMNATNEMTGTMQQQLTVMRRRKQLKHFSWPQNHF